MALKKSTAVLLAASLMFISAGADAAKGILGFGTEATISGLLKPRLKRVRVTSVIAGSPAALAGVKPDDYIVEANGRPIEGSPAREMAGELKNVQPGQQLRLKLKRGEAFINANIIAGP